MTFPAIEVEFSTDGQTWTARENATPMRGSTLSEGAPPYIGSMSVIEHTPDTEASYLPDGTAIETNDPIATGTMIRIMETTGYDDDGDAIEVMTWLGIVIDYELQPGGHGRRYECQHIAAQLESYLPPNGLARSVDGATYQLDEWPIFNRGYYGDRSDATETLAGNAVYISEAGSGNYWTAQQVAETLIAQFNDVAQTNDATAPVWSLAVSGAEATTAAARVAEWDLSGRSLWESFGMLFSGWCQWRLVPAWDGSVLTITVQLGDVTSRSVDGSVREVVVERYQGGQSTRFERVEVYSSERPLCTLTLVAKSDGSGSLVGEWSAGDRTAWLSDRDNPDYSHVATRFRLRDDWDGDSTDSLGLSHAGLRTPSNDDDTRAYDGDLCAPALLEVAGGAAVEDANGNPVLEPPGVWLAGVDISDRCTVLVGHDALGPVIEIRYEPSDGTSGQSAVDAALQAGQLLQLTISIREPTRRRAIWDAGSLPSPVPRVAKREISARQWYVAPSAMLRGNWGSTTGVILSEQDLTDYRDWLVAERFGPNAPPAELEFAVMGEWVFADLYNVGDLVTITDTPIGTVGPARILARELLLDDPAQAVRYRCGRDTDTTRPRAA